MKMMLTLAAALSAVLAASPSAAQRTIAQGMSPDQVRSVFGSPARTRTEGDWSYWFYSNGCPNRCGSDDVVFFRGDQVIAAVLRTRARRIDAPPAADAIGGEGGSAGAAAVRAQAAPAGPAQSQERVIVRGRSRERNGTLPPAEVGGVRVESGAPGMSGQVRDVTPPPARSGSNLSRDNAAGANGAGQSTIIRGGAPTTTGGATTTTGGGLPVPTLTRGNQTGNGRTVTGPGPITAGAQPPATLSDTTGTPRATSVDDERADRESKVTRTTVPNQPDTIQSRTRDRENSVTPRVVPRP
ncbi:hypothetical protein [Longimicrobium sp.]|uniref:hypothetical protein n=1 Tax=Longimicrobium sp. TaxID=2029185 RepID=UPI002C655733|nr:hypothetical protein [Longimicrobium sp.]HSU15827.1 hypothetical protein [Longimicrobium sp.]